MTEQQGNYTKIWFDKRKAHGLSLVEYAILDIVEQLSKKTGWCWMSREAMGDLLGIERTSVIRTVDHLVIHEYLTKDSKGRLKLGKTELQNAQTELQNAQTELQNATPRVAKCNSQSCKIGLNTTKYTTIEDTSINTNTYKAQNSYVSPVASLLPAEAVIPVKIPNSVAHSLPDKLPFWMGNSWNERILTVYELQFFFETNVYAELKVSGMVKRSESLAPLIETYNEWQVAALLLKHMKWYGNDGKDEFAHDKLLAAGYPLEWIARNVNVYIAHLLNFDKITFENLGQIKTYVIGELAPIIKSLPDTSSLYERLHSKTKTNNSNSIFSDPVVAGNGGSILQEA